MGKIRTLILRQPASGQIQCVCTSGSNDAKNWFFVRLDGRCIFNTVDEAREAARAEGRALKQYTRNVWEVVNA